MLLLARCRYRGALPRHKRCRQDEAKENLIGEAIFYTHRKLLLEKLPVFRKRVERRIADLNAAMKLKDKVNNLPD